MTFEQELIRLCVFHDIELSHWVRDDRIDQFNMLVKSMLDSGQLVIDYNKKCRLRVIQGIDKVKEFDVDKFRKYWLKSYSDKVGYAGDKDVITTLLFDFMNSTGYSFEMLCKAAKYYVDDLKEKGQIEYLMKCDNFILTNDGKSTLKAVIDDMNSGTSKNEGGMYELI